MAKTTRVVWENENKSLKFNDLDVGQNFRIVSHQSKGAVYRKVQYAGVTYQLEEQTGMLWQPTSSPVEVVDVEIRISSKKPSVYK